MKRGSSKSRNSPAHADQPLPPTGPFTFAAWVHPWAATQNTAAPMPGENPPPLFGDFRALLLAGAVLLIATLTIFGGILFNGGEKILSFANQDTYTTFVGWFEFTSAQMRAGNLPLWNPHLYSGAPCLGGFQEALLYPPTWLHLVLPLPQAINWGIALHVFLAGFFTYGWMARRGVHPVAALVSGFIFMFGGGYFLHIAAGHLPNLQTMVWAPLIFLAIDDLTTTRSLRGAWLGSFAVMMQVFAGHPQYVYYTALIAGPYALIRLYSAPSRRTATAGLALILIGGVALSAMQLFTGLQAASESQRSALTLSLAGTFPFPPENLATLILPGFFGSLSDRFYWGRWLLWEDCLFIGVTGFALAVYGVIRGEKSHTPRLLLAFLLATLLIAFGSYTPLYTLLFKILPGFGNFRGVSKIAFLASLFFAALAGIGLDRIIRMPKPSRIAPIAIAAGATLVAIVATLMWISGNAGSDGAWAHLLHHVDWNQEAYQHGMLAHAPPAGDFFRDSAHIAARELFWCAGAAVILAAIWFASRWKPRIIYAIAALALVELATFAWQNQPTFDYKELAGREAFMRKYVEQGIPPDARILSGKPSIVLAAGGNDAWGNDPMVLRRYAEFMTLNQRSDTGDPLNPADAGELLRREYPFFTKDTISPTWGMVRVWQMFLLKLDPRTGHTFPAPVPAPGVKLPRALLIENIEVIEDSQKLLHAMADPAFDPRSKVFLEKRPPDLSPTSRPSADTAPGRVDVKDLPGETDEIEVTADVQRPSLLLITDNYSTGWHTFSFPDAPGEYKVIPADHTLRGIPLAPGSHHFILEYRPTAYVVGKWTTIISLIIWLLAGVQLWRGSTMKTPDAKAKKSK